jgi:hypothetical protein
MDEHSGQKALTNKNINKFEYIRWTTIGRLGSRRLYGYVYTTSACEKRRKEENNNKIKKERGMNMMGEKRENK